jgi:hypothetical protein
MNGQRALHPIFYNLSGVMTFIARLFFIVLKFMVITVGITIMGYLTGFFLEIQPFISIELNNGFYYLGADIQYHFAEVGSAIGFVGGLVCSTLGIAVRYIVPPLPQSTTTQQVQTPLTPDEDLISSIDFSNLPNLMETVDATLETKLAKRGFVTVMDLANSKPEQIVDVVGSIKLAEIVIEEAGQVLRKLHRKGV